VGRRLEPSRLIEVYGYEPCSDPPDNFSSLTTELLKEGVLMVAVQQVFT